MTERIKWICPFPISRARTASTLPAGSRTRIPGCALTWRGSIDTPMPARRGHTATMSLAMLSAPDTPRGRLGAFPGSEIGRAHSELQSRGHLVCRLLLEKKNDKYFIYSYTLTI